jgi:hypothetical protein
MYFEIIGEIESIEPIAIGIDSRYHAASETLRDRSLAKTEGNSHCSPEKWRVHRAEIHWYEAHGIGKVTFKIKQFLD